MRLQDFPKEQLDELLKELQDRVSEKIEDVCITGSRVYGCAREADLNIDEKLSTEVPGYKSDIDAIVWCENLSKTYQPRRFFWRGFVVVLKLKPVEAKHDKFRVLYTLPQFSLISKTLFDLDGKDLNAYLDSRMKPPSRWDEGRTFSNLIIMREVKIIN